MKSIDLIIEILPYIVIFFISAILVGFVRYLAIRKSLIDIPNERSSHSVPKPHGGGLAIAITWFLSIYFLYLKKEIEPAIFYALLCGMPISLIGIIDDIFNLSAKFRFIVQLICTITAVYLIGGIHRIDLGFSVFIVPYIFDILSILLIVSFINFFNFIDGIDGYLSSIVIFICLGSFIITGFDLPLVLGATIAGFLIWNWQPAKIFMGDIGSTLLGFNIGVFAIYHQNMNMSSIIFWLMLSSIIWFDAIITIYRRWRNKEILTSAHRKHAYQRIVLYGYSHQKTVLKALSVNTIIFALAYLSVVFHKFLLILFALDILLLLLIIKIVDKKKPFS